MANNRDLRSFEGVEDVAEGRANSGSPSRPLAHYLRDLPPVARRQRRPRLRLPFAVYHVCLFSVPSLRGPIQTNLGKFGCTWRWQVASVFSLALSFPVQQDQSCEIVATERTRHLLCDSTFPPSLSQILDFSLQYKAKFQNLQYSNSAIG